MTVRDNRTEAAGGGGRGRPGQICRTAPVMRRIFGEYLAGAGISAIADRLTRDQIPSPSAYDRVRNPHRHNAAWHKSAVRVILSNPRYTGRQVWNKQRKAEILVDVDDVALGHETRLRWNPASEWIYSSARAHEPLVDEDTFARAQTLLAARGARPDLKRTPRARARGCVLSGMVFCGVCDRRMIGSYNNGRNYYRCVVTAKDAADLPSDHPRSVYLREDMALKRLDPWLATALSVRSHA